MKRVSSSKKRRKSPVRRGIKGMVQRLPPTAKAARDEGPRLIPLGERSKDPSRVEHYLDLADIALGTKRMPKAK